MKRKKFIKLIGISSMSVPVLGSLNKLKTLANSFEASEKMPVLFIGHGSPMNAIEDNEFVQEFRNQAKKLQKPKAIIVISAHWETRGTFVTSMENPRTIHDFGGFPKELYEEQYPAPGHPTLARELTDIVDPKGTIQTDDKWGLDHGAWTVLKHFFPDADVPVIQLSLDYTKPAKYHYELAQQLKNLRKKGILIVGSGNIVHNLRKVAWNKINEPYAYDWAEEANSKMKEWIASENHQALIDFENQGKAFDLAIPTAEHYLPLLYTLGLKDENDETLLFNDQPLGGSLSMTSFKFG